MSIIFLRSIIIYFVLVIAMRVMGKRQIGELQPDELAVSLLLAEVGASPVADVNMPLLAGLLPVITLLTFEVLLSYFSLKSCRVREFISGRPSILIHNGEIIQSELEKTRINMDDLIKELRLKDILDVEEVRYAILETNGQLSVFPKQENQAPTLQDMGLKGPDNSLPFLLISGGKLNQYNLRLLGKDRHWLEKQLKNAGLRSHREVLYMSCDENGQVRIIPLRRKGAKQ